ncbi:uncharacterized protein Z520_10302 [Fonsecaea multimorphosa CBS 102226]|uniref:Uncharacterized protein n=1 Tax=Fonsecaea multimorphosa CBS 102226 TaxID=1442371 RepID=A0A0D2GWJ5_9EURO|nr:uncharacterized protein Z520_10302 [Fonsecaea multimorphosa CBS 102226]KIX93965.1 hypothetical protein Z520_10302 [Fonsecaea multimorphosa CBS 102226]OAL19313.1 hypothetical protein AYO22_09857 [Fonsecaea multimorphosa]
MNEAPPPYHAHDPSPNVRSTAAPVYELSTAVNLQPHVLEDTASPSQQPGLRDISPQEVEQSGFISATPYFELRPPSRPRPHDFFVHTIVVNPHASKETTPYPIRNSLFPLREVDEYDWTTFLNHLFPPVFGEGSSGSNQATRPSPTARTRQFSSSSLENAKSRPEELTELVDRLSLPPTKRSTSESGAVPNPSRLRRIRLETVVAQWNTGFFEPRGLKIILLFTEDSLQWEGDETPLHKAVGRGKESEVRRVLEHSSCDVEVRNKKGETALYRAVSQGDKSIVKLLLENNADPQARPPGANSPLQTAVISDRSSILKMLIEKSTAGLEEVTSAGETPLYLAVARGQTKNVTSLLEAGANPHARPVGKDTMLDLAVNRRDSSILELLLKSGSDPNQRNRDGDTPLNRFVATGSANMVRTLLEYGANPKAKDRKGDPPLSVAVHQGHSSIVALLLAREDVDSIIDSENSKGETPVYTAISRGHTSITEILLKNGADPNKRPPQGETVLNLAVSHGNSTLVNQLLDRGVDVNVANKSGDSPLSQAVVRGDSFMISLLLSAGADVNAVNSTAEPILYRAVSTGNAAVTALLLAHGAKSDVQSHNGEPALYRAVYRGDASISAMLLCYGADARGNSPTGESCLYRAVYLGNTQLVSLLLGRGANPDEANSSNGDSPLYRAVYRGDVSIAMMLLGKGANPTTPSFNNESPLQHAMRKNNKSMMQVLNNVSLRCSDMKRV